MSISPFILGEDNALRNLLLGMTVADQRSTNEGNARPVGVWFGQPDQEIRDQSYPYITIDLIDIAEDRARAHRGHVNPSYYIPSDIGNQGGYIDYPVPINLDYQITTYARQPRHDREILQQLLFTKVPFRFGTLSPLNDSTIRRLDVLDVSKRDMVEQGKRLFMNFITVRVSSEIAQTEYNRLYKVQQIGVTGPTATPRGTYTGVSFTKHA
jgi:hypothetical protein